MLELTAGDVGEVKEKFLNYFAIFDPLADVRFSDVFHAGVHFAELKFQSCEMHWQELLNMKTQQKSHTLQISTRPSVN